MLMKTKTPTRGAFACKDRKRKREKAKRGGVEECCGKQSMEKAL